MKAATNPDEPPRTQDEVDRLMAAVEKSQQLAGHFPDAEALDRARRILTGETTLEAALDEIDAQYMPDPVDEARARRQEAVDQARHSLLLEGLVVDQTSEAESAEYVEGRITLDEFIQRGLDRFPRR